MPEPVTLITEPVAKVEPAVVPPAVVPPVVPPVTPVAAVVPPVEPVKPVVPEKYELKLAEKSSLNQADVDRIAETAKTQGLTNAQAQAALEAADNSIKSYVTRELERTKAEVPKWLDELKADKEYGGEKFNETVENARRVVDKYADKDFKDFLNNSGLGNHPMIVKMFSKLGRSFGEDHFKDGSAIVPKKGKTSAEILYDKSPALKQS